MMCSARSFGSASSSVSERLVLLRRRAALARAGERAAGDLAVLARGTGSPGCEPISVQRGRLQIKHERRRVDDPQRAVDVERVGRRSCTRSRWLGTNWKMSPALMYSLPLRDGVLELLARHVAVELRASSGPRGSISPSALVRRLLEAVDDLVDPPAGVAVGGSSASPLLRRQVGVGDDLDRLVDVVEDDQLAVQAEQQVRQPAVVLRRRR